MFFKKALKPFHILNPYVLTTDKDSAYPIMVEKDVCRHLTKAS